jgi:hypothetical protein
VLEKLRFLKNFNDSLEQVSINSQNQVKHLESSLQTCLHDHDQVLQEKQRMGSNLTNMLIDYEGKLTELRDKADSVEIEANGLVIKNAENLAIDLNRGTNVDK